MSPRRRTRGIYKKRPPEERITGSKRRGIPEYLLKHEIDSILRTAPNAKARLLILIQWRAGLRVSEVLSLERKDLKLNSNHPVIEVLNGKGGKSRVVPVHAELLTALKAVLDFIDIQDGKLIKANRGTAWRWIQKAVKASEDQGMIELGKNVGTHTLRHSYARHMLANGVPIHLLSVWLGHANLETTLIYLKIIPDPTYVLDQVE